MYRTNKRKSDSLMKENRSLHMPCSIMGFGDLLMQNRVNNTMENTVKRTTLVRQMKGENSKQQFNRHS